MPRRHTPDPQLPLLAFMDEARSAGLTPDQVRQRLRSGEWRSVGRGAYLPSGDAAFTDSDAHARKRIEHGLRAVAAARRNRSTVVTDASAAILSGLPVLRVPEHVQLAVPPGLWSGTRSGVDFRVRDFSDDDVVGGGVRVASAARCWIDITRFGSLAESLIVGDFGIRSGLMSREVLSQDLDRWSGQRGCRRIQRSLTLLDATRETPLESASFAYFVEHRIALPRMQVEIRMGRGEFIARVDFLWDRVNLVGEADGRLKYEDADALYAEKRREDRIRAEGYHVIRWGWAELRSRDLARRLRTIVTDG